MEDEELARLLGIADPELVEILVRPRYMMHLRRGDCDDFSQLVACLHQAAGIDWNFDTVAADRKTAPAYSHVYVIAYPNGHRTPLDASHGKYPGWEAPRIYRRRSWPRSWN
jgi:hypothetical protein